MSQYTIKDSAGREVFQFNAGNAALYIGANGNEGDIIVRDGSGREVFHFNAAAAALYVGGTGNEADIIVRDGQGRQVFHYNLEHAALYVGANGNEGDVIVRDGTGAERIRLDGGSGDIKLSGADCAEEFLVSSEDIMPGTVLVIGDCNLRPCQKAYDRRVAGIVSGANGYSPGIILDKVGGANRLPVALTGKAYCKVDTQYG